MAGFSPIRVMIASAFLATFTIVKTRTIHGIISRPLGTLDKTESSILKKMTFVTISVHILPNIRHQPPNISDVLLLPPIANASGAVIVSTARITYLSAISSKSLNTLSMIIRPKMITSSQAAPREPNTPSSTSVTLTASGISKSSMILAVRLSPTSQICGLAISRKANTKVLVNNSFGSSPSKPRPTAILLRA